MEFEKVSPAIQKKLEVKLYLIGWEGQKENLPQLKVRNLKGCTLDIKSEPEINQAIHWL